MVLPLRLHLLRDASDKKSNLPARCRQKRCPAVLIDSDLLLAIFYEVKAQTKLAHLIQYVLAHLLLVLHLKLPAVDWEVAGENNISRCLADEEVIRQQNRCQGE